MSDVTRILNAIERGDTRATDELLPLVYEELRLLATQKLSHEPLGQTLQATALVHEAYIRLVGDDPPSWGSRGHFFAAATEAMLVSTTATSASVLAACFAVVVIFDSLLGWHVPLGSSLPLV